MRSSVKTSERNKRYANQMYTVLSHKTGNKNYNYNVREPKKNNQPYTKEEKTLSFSDYN
jgi:hypothetical protein